MPERTLSTTYFCNRRPDVTFFASGAVEVFRGFRLRPFSCLVAAAPCPCAGVESVASWAQRDQFVQNAGLRSQFPGLMAVPVACALKCFELQAQVLAFLPDGCVLFQFCAACVFAIHACSHSHSGSTVPHKKVVLSVPSSQIELFVHPC